MKVIAKKMLQMRDRLKSTWQLIRQKIASAKGLQRLRGGFSAPRSKIIPAARERRPRSRLARTLRIVAIVLAVFLATPYFLVPLYGFVNPPVSALMVRKMIAGANVRREWVDIEDISPHLVTAVLLAEDATFCRHRGVDWNAVAEAWDAAEDGDTPRGASTITMQTAKNLFLWNGQDYVRKGLEVPLAYYMSFVLSKQRVAEIYLNIAEWGPGIFGAEAAARYHFGKSAAALTRTEASLLAASLPSPLKRRAGRPSARLARIATHIGMRMDREARDVACVGD